MKNKKIAIIGSGICGLAVSKLLAENGHWVTLFDRFSSPESVGAGILLQPIGLMVLREMGLLDSVRSKASRIDGMIGTNQFGKRIMDIRYGEMQSVDGTALHGLGVHRTNLFNVLYQAALDAGVSVVTEVDIENYKQINVGSGFSYELFGNGTLIASYDAIIIANGSNSSLRDLLNVRQSAIPYSWGALWAVLPDTRGQYNNALAQRYQGSWRMAGVLPTGSHPETNKDCVSFFWSLPVKEYTDWQQCRFDYWKKSVLEFEPDYADLLDQLVSRENLTFARYGDVVMRAWHDRKVVCVGDAAHAMSPQLGLGANMALVDAFVLNDCILRTKSLQEAFSNYSAQRRKHLRYYHFASRWLTPLFQSNSYSAGLIRDIGLPLINKIPFTYKEALRTISGIKTGILFDRSLYEL